MKTDALIFAAVAFILLILFMHRQGTQMMMSTAPVDASKGVVPQSQSSAEISAKASNIFGQSNQFVAALNALNTGGNQPTKIWTGWKGGFLPDEDNVPNYDQALRNLMLTSGTGDVYDCTKFGTSNDYSYGYCS